MLSAVPPVSDKQELLSAVANDDAAEMLIILQRSPTSVIESVGSALHVAAMYGSIACTKQLLEENYELDCEDKDGHTPLHYAAVEGDPQILQMLIAARADLHRTTRDTRARLMSGGLVIDMAGGRNALHLAAENGNVEAAEVLYEVCPILADMEDLDGARPRDVALREGSRAATISTGRKAVIELLGSEPIPSQEELRAQAQADAEKRRQRLNALEAKIKARKEEEKALNGRPADHGYEGHWPKLYGLQSHDLQSLMHPDLVSVLSMEGDKKEAFKKICEEVIPGVYAFQVFNGTSTLNLQLLEELEHIEAWAVKSGWQLSRPNSMNRSLDHQICISLDHFGSIMIDHYLSRTIPNVGFWFRLKYLGHHTSGGRERVCLQFEFSYVSPTGYGLVLKDVGLAAVAQSLTRALVWPLAALLWQQFSHLEVNENGFQCHDFHRIWNQDDFQIFL